MTHTEIEKQFAYLGEELLAEIIQHSNIKEVPKNTELIHEGQYVKVVPIVLSGLVKVFTRQEERELLLYYIQPKESCVMSFSACLNNETSRIYAVTLEESLLILIPADKLARWVTQYPKINQLFYQQYDLRYSDLINTISHLLYDKLDKRLLTYLTDKVTITGKNPIKITHKEIANELATAREVISRLIKKLEKTHLIKQHHDSIELL